MTPRRAASVYVWAAAAVYVGLSAMTSSGQGGPAEAPAAFDNQTNGFITQAEFDVARAAFAEAEDADEGLGPVFNAESCAACHQDPVTGGTSQINELRAGHLDAFGNFVDAPGGSLINDRATDPRIHERVPDSERVRAFRMSLSILGLGYVEAIDSNTLIGISRNQAILTGGRIAGQVIQIPVLEAPGAVRVGRFGWKNQHASLLSFSADAYLNEMGVTSRLQPDENTSLGRSVADFDPAPDPEDLVNNDIDQFAAFMRATKAPPRDLVLAATPDAQAGSLLFNAVGCNVCHVRTIVTAPPGTVVNGGELTVSAALGNKIIHPFSDYLLHNVGTGDGIVQNGGRSTANKVRTQPLWGARTRTRHMHDGLSLTFTDAILRHAGEAAGSAAQFRSLSAVQRNQIVRFLESL